LFHAWKAYCSAEPFAPLAMNSLPFTLSEATAPANAVEVVTSSRLRWSTKVDTVTSSNVRS
jgi:hypothetical protein